MLITHQRSSDPAIATIWRAIISHLVLKRIACTYTYSSRPQRHAAGRWLEQGLKGARRLPIRYEPDLLEPSKREREPDSLAFDASL